MACATRNVQSPQTKTNEKSRAQNWEKTETMNVHSHTSIFNVNSIYANTNTKSLFSFIRPIFLQQKHTFRNFKQQG